MNLEIFLEHKLPTKKSSVALFTGSTDICPTDLNDLLSPTGKDYIHCKS